MADLSVIGDAATTSAHDLFHFERYVDPLVSVFTNPNTQTPFTVGVFGSWGSGKSTLLKMLDEKLEHDHADRFVRVWFNPWYYRREPNMLIPLLHTLHDTLDEQPGNRFKESAKKIADVLIRLGADVLLRAVTLDKVSLKNLDSLEKKYFEEHSKVQSQMRKLRNALQDEANAVDAEKAKIIFFIDDLDRCQPDEIIDVLESVKLFLDVKHVFIVLAADKEVIDRGIEVKYSKFEFSRIRKVALGAEYLEKMVQLPLQLFPLHRSQVRRFIESLGPPQAVSDQLDLLQTIVLPNPRKIKRILNILAIAGEMARNAPGVGALKPDLIARLVVIQVQSGDLYTEAARQPDLLVALEKVYRPTAAPDRIRLDTIEDFRDFKSRAEGIREICQQYFQPEGYLAALFKNSGFAAVPPEELPLYLSMLGA